MGLLNFRVELRYLVDIVLVVGLELSLDNSVAVSVSPHHHFNALQVVLDLLDVLLQALA